MRPDDPRILEARAALGLTDEVLRAPLAQPSLDQARAALAELKVATKRRYRELALELHPDRTGNDAAKAARFAAIATVYADLEKLEVRAPPPPVRFVVWRATSNGSWSTATTSTTSTNAW